MPTASCIGSPTRLPSSEQPALRDVIFAGRIREKRVSKRIGIRVGEALVAGGPSGTAAEPEVAIGDMDGPFGTSFANLLGNQVAGHSRVLALLNTDVMVRPPTLCVSKVTVTSERYTNILM